MVIEGANSPTTPTADEILADKGVHVVPDVMANAGGVVVSYFEWVQNLQHFRWDEREVNDKLGTIMRRAYREVAARAERGRGAAARRRLPARASSAWSRRRGRAATSDRRAAWTRDAGRATRGHAARAEPAVAKARPGAGGIPLAYMSSGMVPRPGVPRRLAAGSVPVQRWPGSLIC